MGMRNLLLFNIFIFICLISSGQSESSKVEFDSLINYEVKKKETLYSISNKFNLQIDDIIKYNPELNTEKLKKKSLIIIPLKKTLRKIENAKIVDKIISNDTISEPIKLKVKKDLLKVAYLAPFKMPSIEIDSVENLNSYLKEINLTTISINFYNGIIHAIDELKKNNVSVDLDVFDTDNNISQVEIIRENNDFDNYDLIIGPLINRNFNAFFKKEFKSNSISPLVYDGINLNSNTIVPEANDLLKREKMFSIIDDLILNNQDQCALIISDSLNQKSKNALLERFPLAEIIDLNKINNSVDPKVTDSLLGFNKENWVFLETKKPNLVSSVTSLLNSQITDERKIKLFSTVSNENYENPNVNYEKLGNLSFMYPSNSSPNSSEIFLEFQQNFLSKFKKYPDRISIKSFDIIKDILYRISVSKSFKNSLEIGETKSMQNKFNYVFENENGFKNTSFFILKHEDLDIIDYQN